MMEQVQKECPCNGIKGLREINLEQNSWLLTVMEQLRSGLHCPEVVMDGTAFDEGTLDWMDKVLYPWREANRECLGDELVDAMD
jgi:hypothetical protein